MHISFLWFLISLAISFAAGWVIGYLVFRNNAKLKAKIDSTTDKVSKL